MPFTLIKGTFRVVGYQPDGDSFKLRASNPNNWKKLAGPKVNPNAKGDVQLRFEGVDTLETHFQGTHQPRALADAATDFNLASAGIANVVWGATRTFVTSANDGVDGYILSRTTERNRRPVCFVFAGKTNRQDGSAVFLDGKLLRESINYKLLRAGQAYPTYYDGLFADLRQVMTQAVVAARKAGKGLWPEDRSSGLAVNNLATITEHHPILPKLFRRLVPYIKSHGNVVGFKDHLAAHPEGVLLLPEANKTHFDTVIDQSGGSKRVALARLPEQLVFDS